MNTSLSSGGKMLLGALCAAFVLACSPSKDAQPATPDNTAAALRIEHAWARSTPPGSKVSAAYLTLTNIGTQDVQVVGAHFDIANVTELHSMSMSDGMMRMRKLDDLDIPAGSSVALAPGGSHLMLMGLKSVLSVGQTLSGALILADGREIPVQLSVRNPESTS